LTFLLVFIGAAAVLLAVEYAVVSALFDRSIATAYVGTSLIWQPDGSSESDPPPGESPDTITIVTQAQESTRDDVLGGLIFWSALTLAGFSLVSSAVAWWMAGRPLRRIREVTRITREISEHDLDERLDLTGPRDEIKELGDTIDGMLSRLQIAFTNQSEFVANASHELRTPLAISRTALEIPLHGGEVPDRLRAGLARAIRANRRSETILDSLLTLARSTSARLPAHESIDLATLIDEEVDALSDEAIEASVSIRRALRPPLLVRGDSVLVGILVRNLLANAIRYNVRDGTIVISGRQRGPVVEITVTNTGAIVDDRTDDLVKPFHRGTASRLSAGGSSSGTGLGLAIVDSIARAHEASLQLTARVGGGLTARVVFPVSPGQAG
jgi:signal transduction histidine kinase